MSQILIFTLVIDLATLFFFFSAKKDAGWRFLMVLGFSPILVLINALGYVAVRDSGGFFQALLDWW